MDGGEDRVQANGKRWVGCVGEGGRVSERDWGWWWGRWRCCQKRRVAGAMGQPAKRLGILAVGRSGVGERGCGLTYCVEKPSWEVEQKPEGVRSGALLTLAEQGNYWWLLISAARGKTAAFGQLLPQRWCSFCHTTLIGL